MGVRGSSLWVLVTRFLLQINAVKSTAWIWYWSILWFCRVWVSHRSNPTEILLKTTGCWSISTKLSWWCRGRDHIFFWLAGYSKFCMLAALDGRAMNWRRRCRDGVVSISIDTSPLFIWRLHARTHRGCHTGYVAAWMSILVWLIVMILL